MRAQKFLSKLGNSTVEAFDIFGQAPSFRVLDQGKYTTSFGCIATILICNATILYLAIEFQHLFQKSEPKVVASETQIFDSTSFPLYNENFTIAISIANTKSQSIVGQYKYYNITVSHCIRERRFDNVTGQVSVTQNCLPMPTAPCVHEDFETDLQKDFFKNIKLGVVQCIDRERLKTNPPVLQGIVSAQKYQYLMIEITLCKNSTDYQECAPIEEIYKTLSAGYYVVYSSDYLMQLDRGSKTFQEFINMDVFSFSRSTSKFIQQTYRIQEVHTDDGLFLDTDDISLNLRKQDRLEQTDLYNDNYMIRHTIQLDYKETIYKRSYIKIQVILSKIGGIWQLFLFLCSAFLSPLINNLMFISIANKLYRFPKNREYVSVVDLKHSDSIIELNQIREQQQNALNEKQELLSNGLAQSLTILFSCRKKEKKMFNRAKCEILQKMDVVKIISKLQEMDMLKQLLLDEEQLKLFDLIPQPIIKEEDRSQNIPQGQNELIEDPKSSYRLRNNQQLDQSRINQYFSSFSQIAQSKTKNEINEKLLNLIDKNIVKHFEKLLLEQQLRNTQLNSVFKGKMDESIFEPSAQR